MASKINIDNVVQEARETLEELELAGDLSVYDDFEGSAASKFSQEDMRDRVLDGARYVSARVSANHQPDNVREISSSNTSEIDKSNDRILEDPNSSGDTPMLRLIGTSITVGGNNAQRRTIKGNMKLEDTGRSATKSRPAYVYEDFEFIVEEGDGSGTVKADVVSLLEPSVSFDGQSWSYSSDTTVPLPPIFREALVQYVVRGCLITMREVEMAQRVRNRLVREIAPYALPDSFNFQDE